ncbi:hypothetical protein NECAME_08019 [Necator americanus]|uniref:Uncharacterized protein n=1 Tax=Necator americanus TaxID=51031 RepID=W2TL65_NECAM|nr:hypothetical protein NECAME_08019 [Necator americanus]ETN82369.1 hypothetical protein NECAME_08019 [Necator americanus]
MLGLESWFHNFSQFIYIANTPEVLADIPRPYAEYAIYGFFKGAELTSILGGCVAHPIYRWYLHRQLKPENTTPNSHKIIRTTCRKLQGRFLLFGLFTGPVVALIHAQSLGDEMALRNLCYKIRCDTFSLSIDRTTALLGFLGWYWKRFQGAVDFINVGIAYAIINNKIIAPRTSPLLKDKVQPQERYESVEAAAENRSRLRKFLAEKEKRKALASEG